jgi:hypothetical protein
MAYWALLNLVAGVVAALVVALAVTVVCLGLVRRYRLRR